MPGSRAGTRSSLQQKDAAPLPNTSREGTGSQAQSRGTKKVVKQAATKRGVKRKAVEESASPDVAPENAALSGPEPLSNAKPARSRAASKTAEASATGDVDGSRRTRGRGGRKKKATAEAKASGPVSADRNLEEPEIAQISQQRTSRKARADTRSARSSPQQDAESPADQSDAVQAHGVTADTDANQQETDNSKQGRKAASKRTATAKGSRHASKGTPATRAADKSGRQPSKRQRIGSRIRAAERDTKQDAADDPAISSSSNDEAPAELTQDGEQALPQANSLHDAATQSISSAARRTRAKASMAKSASTATGSSQADKAQKATAGRPAAMAASGAARLQRDAAQQRQYAQQQQQQPGNDIHQGDSIQTATAPGAEPLTAVAKAENAALASMVLQQTLGIGLRAKPCLEDRRSEEDRTAGVSGATAAPTSAAEASQASPAQLTPAKAGSLFSLASSLAARPRQDTQAPRMTMLPFMPQRQGLAAQQLQAGAAGPALLPSSAAPATAQAAAARAAAQAAAKPPRHRGPVQTLRPAPAAEVQQAAAAAAALPAPVYASVPCYEPGFLTRPFSVSAFLDAKNDALDELQQYLSAADAMQGQYPDIEAASMRVTTLEEQLQAVAAALPPVLRQVNRPATDAHNRRPNIPAARPTALNRPPGQTAVQGFPPLSAANPFGARPPALSQPVPTQPASNGVDVAHAASNPHVRATAEASAGHAAQTAQPTAGASGTGQAAPATAVGPQERIEQAAASVQTVRGRTDTAERRPVAAVQQRSEEREDAAMHRSHLRAADTSAKPSGGLLGTMQNLVAGKAVAGSAPHTKAAAQQPPDALLRQAHQAQQSNAHGTPPATGALDALAKTAMQSSAGAPGSSGQAPPAATASNGGQYGAASAALHPPAQAASHAASQAATQAAGTTGPSERQHPSMTAAAPGRVPQAAPLPSHDGAPPMRPIRTPPHAQAAPNEPAGIGRPANAGPQANGKAPALTPAVSAAALAATERAIQDVKDKWKRGLDAAAKDLSCLKFLQRPTKAARRRWSRNTGMDKPIQQASDAHTLAAAAGPSLGADPVQPPAGGSVSDGGVRLDSRADALAQDAVLIFGIHRFDNNVIKTAKPLVEVAVLASQPLTALRDAIHCEADANMGAQNQSRPAGFFYIEGVFYNDMRNTSADYSLPITDFCEARQIKVPPSAPASLPAYPPAFLQNPQLNNNVEKPQALLMEKTLFKDLHLRVGEGAGYVYTHQGCCEHLLELKDVRTVQKTDPALSSKFPVIQFEESKFRRPCSVCRSVTSTWVTYDDRHGNDYPCFWCDACYRQMHYDKHNSLVYSDYIALPYLWEVGMVKMHFKDSEQAAQMAAE